LFGIMQIDPGKAMKLAKGLENDNEGTLTQAIVAVYSANGGVEQWPFI